MDLLLQSNQYGIETRMRFNHPPQRLKGLQSNQYGIETTLARYIEPTVIIYYNRTNMELRRRLNCLEWLSAWKLQSNQYGIETT